MGELQVRGPWVAARTTSCPRRPSSGRRDGWFRTGDIVTIDREGYVKITDRIKDLIKSGGEWISSIDLENALIVHPAVQEAAVIAVAHRNGANGRSRSSSRRPETTPTRESLDAHLASRVASYARPDAYVFVDELPKTSRAS